MTTIPLDLSGLTTRSQVRDAVERYIAQRNGRLNLGDLFDSATCGRCGGSGRYSYNTVDGDRCYGCGGRGRKLTKVGQLVRDRYVAGQERPVGEVEPGMVVYCEPGPMTRGGWWTVTEVAAPSVSAHRIHPDGTRTPIETVTLTVKNGERRGFSIDATVRVAYAPEERIERLTDALVLQANVTKSGTPRKAPVIA